LSGGFTGICALIYFGKFNERRHSVTRMYLMHGGQVVRLEDSKANTYDIPISGLNIHSTSKRFAMI
jgi:hypothetical protein